MITDDIVIIGAGLAGAKTAVALRDGGFEGTLTLIGDEARAPYERPPLSKDYLQGESVADDALVVPAAWYDEHRVTRIEGVAAERIDREKRRVRLDDGREIGYDALVLATGSTARRLPIPGAEIARTLRNFDDADVLKAAFTTAASVVIIGAGWIGLETAAAARHAGLTTTVLEQASLPLQRILGDRLAGHFADLHRAHDVDLRTGVSVESVSGTGPFVVHTGDGDIEADLVVMGVGAAPATALAEQAGLAVDGGITVDQHFRTSDPAIYAIGDVAAAHNTAMGRSVRVEHWDNAQRQGEAVAKILLGDEVDYDWQPYFFTDQFDLGMEYVGLGDASQDVVVRGDMSGGEFLAFWLDGDRVTAGMNVNIWDVSDDIRSLVGRTVDRTRLSNPEVPLTEVTT